MGIEQWSTTPGDNTNAKSGINWDEGMAPSAVNDSARSTLAAVREWYEDAEWIKLGENGSANAYSISYVSATLLKFPGVDRRSLVPVGRRIKAGVGLGTIYGTVTDSSLSASDTQVTISFDSGSLDSSLSYVSLGILAPTNNSFPRGLNASFSDVTVTGRLTGATGILSTAVSATGTSVSFTPIPSWAKKVTVMYMNLSTSGTSVPIIQIGDSGGIGATGYLSSATTTGASSTSTNFTTGFAIEENHSAAQVIHGACTLTLMDASTNTWIAAVVGARSNAAATLVGSGSKALSATLDRVRITMVNGTDTFDGGIVNIMYE